ncbi:transketolase family protein [Candidatus Parcubacteria bacterium]|nr:transketolase family protein [Patescibacteria group bacterium]MCG2694226.1 transketolase family protein [Candidatus Parcubacteria bacterium]
MFNPKAKLVKKLFSKDIKKIPTRHGYGEGVVLAGEKNKNIVVLCCDLTESTRNHLFKQKFPDRFIEAGIAEQNMAAMAAGMALCTKVPFIASYAMFSPGRAWEQIRTTICYNETNVKIVGAHAGVSVGPDGATHQAIEDIALTRVLPKMTVVVPCDYEEAKKATIEIAKIVGACYIRLGREATPVFTTPKTPFKIGRAEILREGKDVTIVACGSLVYEALKAAKELEKEKIDVRVINNHTIKPLDKSTLLQAAKQTGAFITVEEHQKNGGMGSSVCEFLAENYPIPVERIGVDDMFGESGTPEELLDKFGLTAPYIIKAVKKVLKRK